MPRDKGVFKYTKLAQFWHKKGSRNPSELKEEV